MYTSDVFKKQTFTFWDLTPTGTEVSLKSKNLVNEKNLNTASSIIILVFSLPTFIFSSLLITHSKLLVFIILINIILYLLIYNFISKNLKFKK